MRCLLSRKSGVNVQTDQNLRETLGCTHCVKILLILALTNWLCVRSKSVDTSAFTSTVVLIIPTHQRSECLTERGWSRTSSLLIGRCQVCPDWAHHAICTLITTVYWCLGASQTADTCVPLPATVISWVWGVAWVVELWKIPGVDKLGNCCSALFFILAGIWGRWWGAEKNCGLHLALGIFVHFYSKRVRKNYLRRLSSVCVWDYILWKFNY